MTVVIQPNVVTPDGQGRRADRRARVLVTATRIEPLHDMPRGFVRV
jgi:hypothetical protein